MTRREGVVPTVPPLFSVIIPTYNRPDLLRCAVESVLTQTIQDLELIVVDDGSPTPVEAHSDERVIVVRQNNAGSAAAVNAGVQIARGRYLARLDDDDEWAPRRLEWAVEGLSRAPVTVCGAGYMNERWRAREGADLDGDVADTILDTMTPAMGATAVAREVWLEIREDFRSCEDVEWWLRTAQVARVSSVAQLGLLVRRHDGERHLSGDAERRRDNLRLIAEHRSWFDRHPRAEAYRLRRDAVYAISFGDRAGARRSLLRSVRLRPSLRTTKQLLTTFPRPFGRD